MPLLSNKLHVPNPIWRKKKNAENDQSTTQPPQFYLPETHEICSSSEEVERKKCLYNARIWTCRTSGKTNLTYRESLKSEANYQKMLRKRFPKYYEKFILEQVHLSKSIFLHNHPEGNMGIEQIAYRSWCEANQQFHVSEPVRLKVDSASSKPIEGIINNIDKTNSAVSDESAESENNKSTISPNNSDKENTTVKKTTPIKKKYAYSIKVLSEVPIVVHDVPADSIDRLTKPPSKEHIRFFIRTHAMRYGPSFSGPWIVDRDLLRRYKIPPGSLKFQVDKEKLKQMSDRLEEEFYQRIKNKTNRLAAVNGGDADANGSIDGAGPSSTSKLSLPVTSKWKWFSVLHDDDDFTSESKKATLKSEKKSKNEDELPLSSLMKQNNNSSQLASPNSDSGKKMKQSLLHFGKQSESATVTGKKESTTSTPNRNNSGLLALPKSVQRLVKVFNQDHTISPAMVNQINVCARLLRDCDMIRLPVQLREAVQSRRDAIARRDMLHKMNPEERRAFLRDERKPVIVDETDLLADNSSQLRPLPQPTPVNLPNHAALFGRLLALGEFCQSFQNLLLDVTLDYQQQQQEADYEAMAPANFPVSPLESNVVGGIGQLLLTPMTNGQSSEEGDDNDSQDDDDDDAHEVKGCQAPLSKLTSSSFRRLGLVQLVKAVVGGDVVAASSFRALSRCLTLLLRLVLRDDDFNKTKELGVKLSNLPVNLCTASELMRLVLCSEVKQNANVSKFHSSSSTLEQLIAKLNQHDLYELGCEERLEVLESAVSHLLDLDFIDDHMAVCQRRAVEAHSRKVKLVRDRQQLQEEVKRKDAASKPPGDEVTPDGDGKEQANDEDHDDDQPQDSDLASIVKRRRVLAALAAVEREEKEALERERRAVEAKRSADERLMSSVLRTADTCQAEYRAAYRVQPLGYDRYHRRLWYFRCAPDCLFVESNWVHPHSHLAATGDQLSNESDPHPSLPSLVVGNGRAKQTQSLVQPSYWSNWAFYHRPDQLTDLVSSLLVQGLRESKLKAQLTSNDFIDNVKVKWQKSKLPTEQSSLPPPPTSPVATNNDQSGVVAVNSTPVVDPTSSPINDATKDPVDINQNSVNAPTKRTAESLLVNALFKSILDLEVRLRSGGLGGVPDFSKWQLDLTRVLSSFGLDSSDLEISLNGGSPNRRQSSVVVDPVAGRLLMAQALLEVGQNVIPKFLRPPKLLNGAGSKNTPVAVNGIDQSEEEQRSADAASHSSHDDDSSSSSSDDESQVNDEVSASKQLLLVSSWISCWAKEVEAAQTLSRLGLLHACLDDCICWDKSVEDASCRICRRKADDQNLLLCDGCNLAFHLYCLRPPLRRVPQGDWFCASCRPATSQTQRQKDRDRRKQRRRRATDQDDEESDSAEEEASSSDFEDSNSRRRPSRLRNNAPPSRSTAQSVKPDHFVKPSRAQDDACLLCDETIGELIFCDLCPNSFHPACHTPPLRHQPRRQASSNLGWICATCKPRRDNFRALSANLRLSKERRRTLYLTSICAKSSGQSSLESSTTSTRPNLRRHSIAPTVNHQRNASSSSTAKRRLAGSDTGLPANKRSRRLQPIDDSSSSEQEESDVESQTEPKVTAAPASQLCKQLLSAVRNSKFAWPFRQPVDKSEVPDYYEIVVNPVDLGLIQRRFDASEYFGDDSSGSSTCIDQVRACLAKLMTDLGQMFYNAELYNAADSDIWKAGSSLEQFVKRQFTQLKIDVVFMGSAKYPTENDFDEFISNRGGESNAWTGNEHTLFHFFVKRRFFAESIDRFAQFFTSPLLARDSVNREIEAVNNEYELATTRDSSRMDHFIGTLSSSESPYQIFGYGNTKSLIEIPLANKTDVYKLLQDHHKQAYTAQHMTLAILSNHTLDELEAIVRASFSDIPNNGLPVPDYSRFVNCFNTPDFNKIYKVCPIGYREKLRITWVLPPMSHLYESSPIPLISSLIGHEGPGSILTYLKKMHMATSLSSGMLFSSDFNNSSIATIFETQITLTDNGRDDPFKVCEVLFAYVNLILASALDDEETNQPKLIRFNGDSTSVNTSANAASSKLDAYVDEYRALRKACFLYNENDSPEDTVVEVANMMCLVKPEHVFSAHYLYKHYDKQLLIETLKAMTPDLASILILSSKFASSIDQEVDKNNIKIEPWFNVRYTVEDIPKSLLETWKTCHLPLDQLHLPDTNRYIINNFDLLSCDGDMPEPCDLNAMQNLEAEKRRTFGKLWFQRSTQFKVPKACVIFHFWSPTVTESRENRALNAVMVYGLNQTLNTIVYEAGEIELYHDLTYCESGIKLEVTGFSEKLFTFYKSIIDHIMSRESDFSPAQFQNYVEAIRKLYYNETCKPRVLNSQLQYHFLRKDSFLVEELVRVLNKQSVADLQAFKQNFFSQLRLTAYCYGNMTQQDAIQFFNYTTQTLKCDPLANRKFSDYANLQPGVHQVRVMNCNRADVNLCVCNVHLLGQTNLETSAHNLLLADILNEPAFNFLRTKETLGYYVSIQPWRSAPGGNRQAGMTLSVCSSSDRFKVDFVTGRMDAFWLRIAPSLLASYTQEQFQIAVDSLISLYQMKDTQMSDVYNRNWTEILQGEVMFNRRQEMIQVLKTITLEGLMQFFTKNYLDPANRRTLSIQVDALPNPDPFVKASPSNTILVESVPIKDEHLIARRSACADVDVAHALASDAAKDGTPLISRHQPDPLAHQALLANISPWGNVQKLRSSIQYLAGQVIS